MHTGTEPPEFETLLWFDENPEQRCHKYFDFVVGVWTRLTPATYLEEITYADLVAAGQLVITHNLAQTYPTVQAFDVQGFVLPLSWQVLDENTLVVLGPGHLNPGQDFTLTVRS